MNLTQCNQERLRQRRKALASLFDGLTFHQATSTQAWDELTSDEQMHVESHICDQ